MSSLVPETGWAQGASGADNVYDTSPSGLGMNPTYLASSSSSATASSSGIPNGVILPVNADSTGVADSAAAIQAALNTASASGGGIVWLSAGTYKVASTLAMPSNVILTGVGTGITGTTGAERGATTIISSFNGSVISCGTSMAWALRDLTVNGDATQAAQVLLAVGLGTGEVTNVTFINGGLDNIVLTSSLNCVFVNVYSVIAVRYGLSMLSNANANVFVGCRFRICGQFGINLASGSDLQFDRCTIESNNTFGTKVYGGVTVGSATALFTACHFENNSPASGNPLVVSGSSSITTIGCTWAENGTISHVGTSTFCTISESPSSAAIWITSTSSIGPVVINNEIAATVSFNGSSRTMAAGGGFSGREGSTLRTLVAGDFSITAGWGTTASIATIAGTEKSFRIKITSAGTGQAANPKFDLTYPAGTFTGNPHIVANMTNGGTGATTNSCTTFGGPTVGEVQMNGTPSAGLTYEFDVIVVSP